MNSPGNLEVSGAAANPVIVVHYHELWLKGGNRRFFLSKLHLALKRALDGLPVKRILRPGDRLLVEFGEGASAEEAVARIERVFGVAFYAQARVVPRGGEDDLAALGCAAWARLVYFGTGIWPRSYGTV